AFLQEANLYSANLQKANLIVARLQKAHLNKANLQEANLAGAIFQKANIKDAQLQDTQLCDEISPGKVLCADFRGVKNLTVQQVKVAKNWKKAHYDPEFRKQLGLLPEKPEADTSDNSKP
ncbi:MAG: pentapeptide repeat-containing protein, partial [Nostoc sp.]